MTLDPSNNPAIKKLSDQYEDSAKELEAALAAVKGERYATQVRLVANMQSTVKTLVNMICGENPVTLQMAVTHAAASNLNDIAHEFMGNDRSAVKEFLNNVMNLIAARDRLEQEVMQLLNKDSHD